VPPQNSLFDFTSLNSLAPALAVLLQIVAVIGALYGFFRFIADAIGWLRRPHLRLAMSDNIWPVAESFGYEVAINIQFIAYNPGKRMAYLRRLEATLLQPAWGTRRSETTFALTWHSFIKGNPSGFEQTEPVSIRAISPGEPVLLSMQLRGRGELGANRWFPGQYKLHLTGLIDDRRMRLSPRFGFTFELDKRTSSELSPGFNENFIPFTRPVHLNTLNPGRA